MNRKVQRRWLAEQAARYMNEFSIDDPRTALRRVLARQGTGPSDRRQWPESDEILAALRDYQRLFRGEEQSAHLHTRREAAIEAMRFFAAFRPYLVGTTLEGTADAHSAVQLHLHNDDPDAVLLFLQEQGIKHRIDERRIHLDTQRIAFVPHISFDADDIGFELWVLPALSQRQAPLAADGRTPIRRAGLGSVVQLAAE